MNSFKPVISIHYKPRIVRLVVDVDDLKWVANEKNILLIKKKLHLNVHTKTHMCRKLNHPTEMRNDALMHREDIKG